MYQLLSARFWIFLLWGGLIAVNLSTRPLIPVDETRYAAVAWEMWVREDFFVPYLNGDSYSHKPPLLFWLMQLSWLVLGVNDWSLRLIGPLFSLASLFLSRAIARILWPDRKQIEALAPLILLGCFFWIVFSTLTMFDMMLAFFALLGIYSLLKLAYSDLSFKYLLLLGLAIGAGVLTKGPVVLLHLLPVALLAPWWLQAAGFCWRRWYYRIGAAVLIGAGIALCWAIPAGMAGGEAYRKAIFLGQTSGRLVESFAHRLPWWWYLEILPLLLLPWLLWKPVWTGLRKLNFNDAGIRFCLAWAVPVFIAFSLVSGKRIHYLLPLLPALALILARAADEITDQICWKRAHLVVVGIFALLGMIMTVVPALNDHYQWRAELSLISPVWGILLLAISIAIGLAKAKDAPDSAFYLCIASLVASLAVSCAFFEIKADRYDTKVAAQKIAGLMDENRAIAFYGNKYHGQYHFAGRLKQPVTVMMDFNSLYDWAKRHQDGYIIVTYKDADALPESVISYHYPYKSQNIGLLSCKTLLENPSLGSVLKPS